jgi:hypothetical protein
MYSPQGGIPVRLGYCAVLVKLALAEELAPFPLRLEVTVAFSVEDPDVDEAGDVRAGVWVSDVAPHARSAANRRETWKVRSDVGSDKYFILPCWLDPQLEGRLARFGIAC